jgi:hypothetical protein
VHLLSSLLGLLSLLVIVGGFVSLFVRRNRERVRNAPLRAEIEAHVRFKPGFTVPGFSERAVLGAPAAFGFR